MAAGLFLLDLPAEVIIAILSHLPIADAVRTSILCRSLRHQWRSISDLAFNFDDEIDIAAVDHVLRVHSAPIQSFSVSTSTVDHQEISNHLDRWLAALSADSLHLRSFTLDVRSPLVSGYSPPLSFSNLNHLRLEGSSLPNYSCGLGFPVLETLHLSSCIIPDYDSSAPTLIIDCPLLQKLALIDLEYMDLRICAPNLRSFVFDGMLKGFALASAPLLTTVVIDIQYLSDEELNEYNLIKAFRDARSIGKLKLLGIDNSLRFLGKFQIPDRIPDTFERLKVLTLRRNFIDAKETLVLLCLLRSAPNLHEIKIEGKKYYRKIRKLGHEFWQAQNYLELPKLQTLELTHILYVEPILGFIDYILPKARELKKMEINIAPGSMKYGNIGKFSNSKELVLHWRASTRAQIIFAAPESEEYAEFKEEVDLSLFKDVKPDQS